MKKTKLLSLLLCLSLVCTLFVSGTTAFAEGKSDSGDGMVVNKTAKVIDEKGTTRITLEAFATGSQTTSTVHKDIPTDIILVIDQSGSMEDAIGTVTYKAYTGDETQNEKNYDKRHNGGNANLWYKLADNSYVSVSVTKTTTYRELKDLLNYKSNSECYWTYKDNLYEKVGDEYKKVGLDSKYELFEGYKYIYTFWDGTTVNGGKDGDVPNFDGHGPLYTPDEDGNTYTYTYTDTTGKHTIGASTGASEKFTPAFYQRSVSTNGGGSRLKALQNAVTAFADDVAERAAGPDKDINTTEDNVNHRIAVVGYASRKDSNKKWKNTEVFIGETQYNYSKNAKDYYGSAFQDMSTSKGKANVEASINAFEADGATYTNYGLEMANGIFDAYPIPTEETRNRVVVLFTDGYPGRNADDFDEDAARKALEQATIAKGKGVSVYAVGIFSGADATSAGSQKGNNTQKANWFMQNVSSNNGTPPAAGASSFYLSASDSATLNSIFKQISSNIPSGGSATTLGGSAVVKDIISPYFTLPAGATKKDITIKTYDCTKVDGDKYEWSNAGETPSGVSAKIEGNTVSVTGFDFSENWCGKQTTNGATNYRGKKLVITFTVQPKDGFLGGNGVPTNTSAGIYESANAKEPVKTFPVPYVNVPIKPVTVTAADKNVYLLGNVTEAECKNGATAECNGVNLLDKSAYTDDNAWKAEFVEITTEVKDKDGKAIPTDGLQNLTEDTTYTFTATVAPRPANLPDGVNANGTEATAQRESAIGKINVFKPELTFKDTEAYYGADVPDYTKNLTKTEWKHGTTKNTDAGVTMIGTAPMLTCEYTPETGKIVGGKINTPNDFGVAVTVKIGNKDVDSRNVTFQHTKCTDQNCKLPEGCHFLIHVKTCTLTIEKKLAAGTTADAGQRFIFKVTSPNGFDQTVVVGAGKSVTITGLKVGEYTVKEDTAWSWRYTPDQKSYDAELSAGQNNDTKTVTVTNTLKNDKWVTTDVYCKNVFTKDAEPEIVNDTPTTN